jgi:hypothetical protein
MVGASPAVRVALVDSWCELSSFFSVDPPSNTDEEVDQAGRSS